MIPFQVMNSEQKIDQLTHLWNLLITFLLALAVPHTRKKMLHKERRTIEDSTSVTLSCPIFTNHIHRQYSSTSLMTLSKTNECCWRTQCLLVFLRPMFMVFFCRTLYFSHFPHSFYQLQRLIFSYVWEQKTECGLVGRLSFGQA